MNKKILFIEIPIYLLTIAGGVSQIIRLQEKDPLDQFKSHSVSQIVATHTYTANEDGVWTQITRVTTNTTTFSSDGEFTDTGGSTEIKITQTTGTLMWVNNEKDKNGNTHACFIAMDEPVKRKTSESIFNSDMVSNVDKGNFQNTLSAVKNWLSDEGGKNSTPIIQAYNDKYSKALTI